MVSPNLNKISEIIDKDGNKLDKFRGSIIEAKKEFNNDAPITPIEVNKTDEGVVKSSLETKLEEKINEKINQMVDKKIEEILSKML